MVFNCSEPNLTMTIWQIYACYWNNMLNTETRHSPFELFNIAVICMCSTTIAVLLYKIVHMKIEDQSAAFEAYREQSEKNLTIIINAIELIADIKMNSVNFSAYKRSRRDALLSKDIEEYVKKEEEEVDANDALNVGNYIWKDAEETSGEVTPEYTSDDVEESLVKIVEAKIVETVIHDIEAFTNLKKNSVNATDYECIRRDDNNAEGLLSKNIEEHAEDESKKVATNDALNAGEYICDGAEENVGDKKPKDKLYLLEAYHDKVLNSEKIVDALINQTEALMKSKKNIVSATDYECNRRDDNNAEDLLSKDIREYAEDEAKKVAPNSALNVGEYTCEDSEIESDDEYESDVSAFIECKKALETYDQSESDDDTLVNTDEEIIDFKKNSISADLIWRDEEHSEDEAKEVAPNDALNAGTPSRTPLRDITNTQF